MLKKTTRGMTAGMTRRGVGFAVAGGGGPTPLDILASVGTSTSPTSTGTKAVTGVGFEPKVVMPFGSHVTAEGATTFGNINFGGMTASEQAAIMAFSQNAVAISKCRRRHTNSSTFTQTDTNSVVINEASRQSLDADGFTLNWSTAFTDNRILNHICLGGADLEVSLTQHQMNNDNTPQSFAHGLSGTPTGLLLFTGVLDSTNTTEATAMMSIGLWAGSSQHCAALRSNNNAATAGTRRLLDNETSLYYLGSTGAKLRGLSISSVDSTNVNSSYASLGVTFQVYFWMLAIRGAKCQVGTFDCNGSTSPLTISTTGITPKLFLPVFVPGGVDNINTVQNGNALTIGASDGTNTVSCGITDENGVATTNARRHQDSTGLSEYDFDGTLESDSSVSFSGESVILDPSTNTGTTWGQGAYLVIGS